MINNDMLYNNDMFDDTKNQKLLISTVRFIKDPQRFDGQLF